MQIVERSAFTELLRGALAHLYDPPYLRGHPLAELLSNKGAVLPSNDFRRVLLDAVEQIKPPDSAPAHTASRRRYRYLYLRYVEGESHESIARDLLISVRQAHRDHRDGIVSVSSVLWETYRASQEREDGPTSPREAESVFTRVPESSDLFLGSELHRGGFVPGEGPIDLREVIVGVIDIVKRLAVRSGAEIDVSLPPTLPLAAVDRTILRQILLSLLSYAIETEPSGRFRFDTTSRGDIMTLRVWSRPSRPHDSPSSDKANSTDEAEELLAAGRYLAKLHGLDVRLGQAPTRTAGDRLIIEVGVPVARPETVLVVDDNPDVAQLFERYLHGLSYRILSAKTWQQALQLAETAHPDIITLDVMMPSQDGWDIQQRLKVHPDLAGTPVVVCSVLPERSLAMAMGATAFLSKPVTQQNLLAVLRDCRLAHR